MGKPKAYTYEPLTPDQVQHLVSPNTSVWLSLVFPNTCVSNTAGLRLEFGALVLRLCSVVFRFVFGCDV